MAQTHPSNDGSRGKWGKEARVLVSMIVFSQSHHHPPECRADLSLMIACVFETFHQRGRLVPSTLCRK